MAVSSTSLSMSNTGYQLFSYASESEDNRKITAIIENYLAPTLEMERDLNGAIPFMSDVIRLHQLARGTYSLVTRYPNPTFTYLKLLREFAVRMFCQEFMQQPSPKALRDKSDIEWPCRDEVLETCDIAYGRLLITLMTEKFARHPKINTKKWSSMHVAVMSGDAELVNYMIKQPCPLNLKDYDDYSPLHIAIYKSSECVQLLADAKADLETVNKQGKTPLTLAAYNAKLQAVKILLAAGANIEHVDHQGRTPLHNAAIGKDALSTEWIENYLTVIKALINAGAIINQKDLNGDTPLPLAIRGGVELALSLIPGSDVNMSNLKGWTALMWASAKYPCLIDPLIEKGARVNLQNNERRTALFFATSSGQEESVKSLLAAKADPSILDSNGKKAIDYANGNARIIAMLTAPRSV